MDGKQILTIKVMFQCVQMDLRGTIGQRVRVGHTNMRKPFALTPLSPGGIRGVKSIRLGLDSLLRYRTAQPSFGTW